MIPSVSVTTASTFLLFLFLAVAVPLAWALILRAHLRGSREALAAAEARLVRERAEAARLAARAVSELERPMKLLGASLDLALRRRRDTPELAASLEDARREVDRLAVLGRRIELLLEPRSERTPSDLGVIARAAIEEVRPQASARQVELRVDGPQKLPATVDAKALQQAVEEIVSNAVRVTRFGGTVRVTLEDGFRGKLRVKVRDDGPGFGNELPQTVFEPFLYHRTAPAAGLGLALARKVAREHQGDVTLSQVRSGAEVVLEIQEE
jgi:signal transduction histidine kinase